MGEHPATSEDLIEIRDSKTFYGASCVASVGLAMLSAPWMALFLGGYSVWSFLRVVSLRVRVRVTEDGIVDETFRWYSPGLIRWEEMRDIRNGRWGAIEIELKDDTVLLGRLPRLARLARLGGRLLGLGPAYINPVYFVGSRRELLAPLEDALDTYTLATAREDARLPSGGEAP